MTDSGTSYHHYLTIGSGDQWASFYHKGCSDSWPSASGLPSVPAALIKPAEDGRFIRICPAARSNAGLSAQPGLPGPDRPASEPLSVSDYLLCTATNGRRANTGSASASPASPAGNPEGATVERGDRRRWLSV